VCYWGVRRLLLGPEGAESECCESDMWPIVICALAGPTDKTNSLAGMHVGCRRRGLGQNVQRIVISSGLAPGDLLTLRADSTALTGKLLASSVLLVPKFDTNDGCRSTNALELGHMGSYSFLLLGVPSNSTLDGVPCLIDR